MGQSEHYPGAKGKPAWNAGRKLGAKRALKPQKVWAIQFWLDSKKHMRDRAIGDSQHAGHFAPSWGQDAPTSRTRACLQECWTKSGANVVISAAKRAGKYGMAMSPGRKSASLTHPLASSTRSDPATRLVKVELRS